MSKVVGISLVILGLGITAVGVKPIQAALSLASVPGGNTPWIGAGMVLIILGGFLIRKASSTQSPEVPIYEGQNIVGYRKVN
jgi:hypothetical protein